MKAKKIADTLIIRVDRGENLIEKIKTACRENRVTAGVVSAIGAVDRAEIGFYDPLQKEYHSTEMKGNYEITSLMGNVTTANNEPYLHLHINLADEKNRVIGGHLNQARISATCEIFIRILTEKIERFPDDNLSLNLIDL